VSDRRLRNRSEHATFLAYHSVAPQGPTYLTVTAELFERQLEAIAARGLVTADLATLEAIAAGRPIPPSVFLTFDDGFLDNHGTVLPLLRERGMKAFVFVLPPLLDSGAALRWPEVAEDAERHPETMRSVGWTMLEEMRDSFEIGSHTLTHPHLPALDDEQLRHELWESRARVKERLGSCETLAYPFGEWSPRVAEAAAACGYRFAFSLPTTHGQRRAGPLCIPRVNVDYRDSGRRFAAKLSPLGRRAYLSEGVKLARRTLKSLRRTQPRSAGRQ
jgi:peptidoglycan/xylan/chitin deacetylase (PgdA/CDA1 family)